MITVCGFDPFVDVEALRHRAKVISQRKLPLAFHQRVYLYLSPSTSRSSRATKR